MAEAAVRDRLSRLAGCEPYRVVGTLSRIAGNELEIRGLRLAVGDAIEVAGRTGVRPGEVVAVDGEGARALLLGPVDGLARGDRVRWRRDAAGAVVGPALLGRVVDAFGQPVDGGPPLPDVRVPLKASPPAAMRRARVTDALPVGVRIIDTLCTVGRGQRLGIFAGSGVGKSTLLGMMVRGTAADVNVVALIGERGREVREFVEDELGEEGMARTVVVVATSDEPALVRLRAGQLATRIAEWFADETGADVLLSLDSLTRLAMAQREVGLAAGEPPTARGYTPSVFSLLPELLERAGPRPTGSITAFYTVLVEGDDMNEPVADAARSILDGHIVMDRRLASAGRYPAIDPLNSLSRLAGKVTTPSQRAAAEAARAALAAAESVRDLVEVGAYAPGSNPEADRGLELQPALVDLLTQHASEPAPFERSWIDLQAVVGHGDAPGAERGSTSPGKHA